MTILDNDLSTFLAKFAGGDLQLRKAALKAAHDGGLVVWMRPEAATDSARPATHLHEIDGMGVKATGESEGQAVRNWFTVALRQVTPQVAA